LESELEILRETVGAE
jgi:hypothetical protein